MPWVRELEFQAQLCFVLEHQQSAGWWIDAIDPLVQDIEQRGLHVTDGQRVGR